MMAGGGLVAMESESQSERERDLGTRDRSRKGWAGMILRKALNEATATAYGLRGIQGIHNSTT